MPTPAASVPVTPHNDIPPTVLSSAIPLFPDGAAYNSTQTDSAIAVTLLVSLDVTKKDVNVTFGLDTLLVHVHPEKEPRIKGRLFATVSRSDCSWHLESLPALNPRPGATPPTKHRYKLLTIHLQKATRGNGWPFPIVAGVQSNLDVDAHSLFLLASTASDDIALSAMTTAADAGSVSAMLKLAAWYELGKDEMDIIPVKKDTAQALAWHRKAADAGNAEACYILMMAHANGSNGAPKSFLEATRWANSAISCAGGWELFRAEQESLFCTVAFQLGMILMEGGGGLEKALPEASAWLWERAAEADHGPSAWNLGIFWINGFGEDANVTKGLELIKKGMRASPNLTLPPQLAGLEDDGMDLVATRSEELVKAKGKKITTLELEKIVEEVKNAKKNKTPLPPIPGAASGKSSTPASPPTKKRAKKAKKAASRVPASPALSEKSAEVDVGVGTAEWVRRGIAVTVICLGVFTIWRVLKE